MAGIDLERFAEHLRNGDDGVWYAHGVEEVSYPKTGHSDSMKLQADSFWYRHRNRMIYAAVERWRPSEPFFDIGGGTGVVARYLQERGHETVLVEPGEEGARLAQQQGVRNVICGTAVTAGLRRASIPAIGTFDVIEHVDDDAGFVKYLHDLLRPEGMLFASVPAYNWLWSGADVHAGHYRRYSLGGFKELLVENGFTPRYMTYFFRPLPLPIFFLRSLPSMIMGSGKQDRKKVARQHGQGRSHVSRVLDALLEPEVARVERASRIPFGSSILAVASRNA